MEGAMADSHDRYANIQLHTSELIKFRDERKRLRFYLIGGDTMEGIVRWFDDRAIHIVDGDREETTLFVHAIVHYKSI